MGQSVVVEATKWKLSMLKDLLNFPRLVMQTNMSVNDVCTKLSLEYSKKFPPLQELMDALRSDEALIENWISYSEDKRGSPSWYFVKVGRKYKVGYLDSSRKCNEGIYDDPCFACAVFIKLEMESRILSSNQTNS